MFVIFFVFILFLVNFFASSYKICGKKRDSSAYILPSFASDICQFSMVIVFICSPKKRKSFPIAAVTISIYICCRKVMTTFWCWWRMLMIHTTISLCSSNCCVWCFFLFLLFASIFWCIGLPCSHVCVCTALSLKMFTFVTKVECLQLTAKYFNVAYIIHGMFKTVNEKMRTQKMDEIVCLVDVDVSVRVFFVGNRSTNNNKKNTVIFGVLCYSFQFSLVFPIFFLLYKSGTKSNKKRSTEKIAFK